MSFIIFYLSCIERKLWTLILSVQEVVKWLLKYQVLKLLVYFCTKKYSTQEALGRFDGEVIRVNFKPSSKNKEQLAKELSFFCKLNDESHSWALLYRDTFTLVLFVKASKHVVQAVNRITRVRNTAFCDARLYFKSVQHKVCMKI